MTSFSLKECIYYGKENNSKVYICYLDARQAFDRLWHDGLFYKLHSLNIDRCIYKAFYNMYCDMKSRVKCHGLYSDWFPVLQGTRQGGLSSPMLYLIYIDGLIKILQESGYGLCIFEKSFACPTVADDMCLVSFSKKGLDMMMDICYNYSCRWRYEYNHKKMRCSCV